MKAAESKRLKRVAEEGCSIRSTAIEYGIDRKTLEIYVKKYTSSDNKEDVAMEPNYNTGQIFTDKEETVLESYIIKAAKLHNGLTRKTARQFAYQFASANKKKIPQKWVEDEIASPDWLRGFMNRHKTLFSLRMPESTSLSRATAFNRTTVTEFQTNLKTVMERYHFGPESIYNVDETGVTTAHKPEKIIANKRAKQVSKATSADRGILVTLCATVCAIGTSLPPFLMFPRIRVKESMSIGAPPGTGVAAHPSGWMTGENFELYLHHFIKYSKCSKESPVLLVLDNHNDHITPQCFQICKDNGIVLITLSSHTSHQLQPLDRTVFGPFKTFFNQSSDEFLVNHPGKPISIYDIPSLVGKAYPKAFNPVNIQKGFQVTGIFPFDTTIFNDEDFLGPSITDRPNPILNIQGTEEVPKTEFFIRDFTT